MKRLQTIPLVTIVLLLFVSPGPVESDDFSIEKVDDQHIDINFQDRPLARLMIASDTSSKERAHETYKVFTHVIDPLDSEAERTVTKGARHKFTHHRGIFIGWKNTKVDGVGKTDTWHMSGSTRQEFQKIVEKRTSNQSGRVTVLIDWVMGDRKLLTERRTVIVHRPSASGKSFSIDQASTIMATEGDTSLRGDPEHAGYQFRAHQAVAKNNSARYLYPKGVDKSDIQNGKSVPWVGQQIKIDDRMYSIQHMRHPSLPDGNYYSAYRSYGRFGVFFEDSLEEGKKDTYRIRINVRVGSFPDNARKMMSKRYKAYVKETK